jgi:hypothetical protein
MDSTHATTDSLRRGRGGRRRRVIADAVTAQAAVVGRTVIQPFSADSGDPCRMVQTRGDLGWHSDSPRSVDVTGVVADRPLPGTADGACQDDDRSTLTTFTGYSNGTQITQSAVRVDNGHRDVELRLTAPRSIDPVVVRVCRPSPLPGPPIVCGAPQRYPAAITVAG